jgi:hypothetical protein
LDTTFLVWTPVFVGAGLEKIASSLAKVVNFERVTTGTVIQ